MGCEGGSGGRGAPFLRLGRCELAVCVDLLERGCGLVFARSRNDLGFRVSRRHTWSCPVWRNMDGTTCPSLPCAGGNSQAPTCPCLLRRLFLCCSSAGGGNGTTNRRRDDVVPSQTTTLRPLTRCGSATASRLFDAETLTCSGSADLMAAEGPRARRSTTRARRSPRQGRTYSRCRRDTG